MYHENHAIGWFGIMRCLSDRGYKVMNKDNYSTEAQEHWGGTSAYREHEQKTKNYPKEKWAEANSCLKAIFAEFASEAIAVFCQEE